MKAILFLFVLLILVCSSSSIFGDDYPILGYWHIPGHHEMSYDDLLYYDSLYKNLGFNVIYHNLIPGDQTLQSVGESGLKSEIFTRIETNNVTGSPAYYFNQFRGCGDYVPMQSTFKDTMMGYGFDFDSTRHAGDVYKLPGLEYYVRRCKVSDHSAGPVYTEGPVEASEFRHPGTSGRPDWSTQEEGDYTDTILTVKLFAKIDAGHAPSVPVCSLTTINQWCSTSGSSTTWHTDTLGARRFTVADFDITNEYTWIYDSVPANYVGKGRFCNNLYIHLHWYDQVDFYLDSIVWLDTLGAWLIENEGSPELMTKLTNYYSSCNGTNAIDKHWLADELPGGQFPLIRKSRELINQGMTSSWGRDYPDLVGMAPGMVSGNRLTQDVLMNYIQPDGSSIYSYLLKCGMNHDSDDYPSCLGLNNNIQHLLTKTFNAFDSSWAKTKRYDPDAVFRNDLPSGRYFVKRGEGEEKWYYQQHADMTAEDYKILCYMSLAHGADEIAFWTVPTQYFTDPFDAQETPIQAPMPDYNDPYYDDGESGKSGDCDSCYKYTKPIIRNRGFLDRSAEDGSWYINEKGEIIKTILPKVKAIGSVLRECNLIEVGLVDSQRIGWIDSVTTPDPHVPFDPPWIEAAWFEGKATGDNFFMIVNRRLLFNETQTVRVYMWYGPGYIPTGSDIIDVYSGEQYYFHCPSKNEPCEEPPFIEIDIEPGEGYLFRILSNDYFCGDANMDGNTDVSDAVFIINYAFAGGPSPDPHESGDANCDSSVDVSDAVYIINYAFAGGNPPCDTNGDGVPDCPI